jgi:hypothetical protein
MPQVFLGLLFIIILFSLATFQFEVFSHFMSRSRALKRYKPADPTVFARAVRDGEDGVEYLISGTETTLFREACLDNWQFENVDKKSSWYVIDERGNDVSNEPLSRFDGVFRLIGSIKTAELSDESNEYSSIHDSVEYYD